VQGVLGAVPFGLDAGLLLAFAEIADDPAAPAVPVLVTLSAPGVRRTAVEALDVVEPVVAVELGSAAATPLTPAVFPAPEIRTVLAAELVGTARRALEGAVAHAGARHQFGRPIGSFQSIKHMLADRYVQLDAARLLVHHSARAIDTGATVPAGLDAASRTALVAATDAADAATGDALQTHGGIGFTWEHPSHVLLKRARARRSLLGSPGTQLDALAGLLL
jgi:alkylation response protein AidB-like acyl-CoA dehydrogenase